MRNTSNKLKIVLLIGSSDFNKNTLAKFLQSNLDIVGVVICNKKKQGINFDYLKKSLKKQGFFKLFGQICERLYYILSQSKNDREVKASLINVSQNNEIISNAHCEIIYTDDYNQSNVIFKIQEFNPDFIVIHTPYWVGKRIRSIPKLGVIGGHPGITPFYRGVHSSFWAIYNGEYDKIGYSVFFVDKGVDTGAVIYQNRITNIDLSDSYVVLGWKSMIEIARIQVDVLMKFQETGEILSFEHKSISEDSLYYHPTLWNHIKYCRNKKKLLRNVSNYI